MPSKSVQDAVSRAIARSRSFGNDHLEASEPTATHGSHVGVQSLKSAEPWAEKIKQAWNKSVSSIVETGQYLWEAKNELDWDEWDTLLALLPFGKRTAERLMAVGRSTLIVDHLDRMPPSWRTMYELSRLREKAFMSALDRGAINPDMERSEAEALARKDEYDKQQESRESSGDEQDDQDDQEEPSGQEDDVAPEAEYDAASIANSFIAHFKEQLRYLPPPVATEVETIVLQWLHNRAEARS